MHDSGKTRSRLLFAREFLKHPILLGSALPSSRFLVDRLLRQVDWPRTRVLVEYGPGVGTFTGNILKRLRDDATLVAIEMNPDFVEYLRREHDDPRLIVVHGSAADVRHALSQRRLGHADAIISGIPFSTLPQRERERILRESKRALRPGGRFLVYQFTSAVRRDLERVFGPTERAREPLNILPATIFTAMNDAA
ncbi:MAG: class I SAM-dependent methyltransferase [Terriglobales bacterium]